MAERSPLRKKAKIDEIVKAVETSLVGILNETLERTPTSNSRDLPLDLTEGMYLCQGLFVCTSYGSSMVSIN